MATFPLAVWIRSADRTAGMPIHDAVSFSCSVGKHPTQGSASLTVPANAPWLSMPALDISGIEYGGCLSMDVYWRDMTTPLFSGPVLTAEMQETRAGATVSFTFEPWAAHLLNRRIYLSSSYQKADVATAVADTVLAYIMRANGFDAWTTVTPVGYPETRTDFGPITATCAAAGGTHATSVSIDISDGRRLLEEAERLLEAHDMALVLTETSAGAFEFTIDPNYERYDLSSSVVLSVTRGSLSMFREALDYSKLENTLSLVSTAGGGSRSFTSDTTSTAAYGVYEGAYAPSQFDANAASHEGSYLKGRFALPDNTFEADVIDQPGATFGEDYGIRDLVAVESATWGRTADMLVVGAKLSGLRNPRASVVLGTPRSGYDAATREGAGTMLGRGRGLGSRFKTAKP